MKHTLARNPFVILWLGSRYAASWLHYLITGLLAVPVVT